MAGHFKGLPKSTKYQWKLDQILKESNGDMNLAIDLWRKFYYGRTLEVHIEKYGLEEGTKRYNEYRKKLVNSNGLENYIRKYGEEEGKRRYEEKNSKIQYGGTINFYIDKYGKEEGVQRWNEICRNKSYGHSFQKIIDENLDNPKLANKLIKEKSDKLKYDRSIEKISKDRNVTHEEAKEIKRFSYSIENKINNLSSKLNISVSEAENIVKEKLINAAKLTWNLENYIRKYGFEEGTRRYQEFIRKISESNSLDSYQEKYGNKLGYIKFRERNDKWAYTMSLQGHIDRYGEELGTTKYNELIKSRKPYSKSTKPSVSFNNKSYSLISNELFSYIDSIISKYINNKIRYSENEYIIPVYDISEEFTYLKPDFHIEGTNIIIEFYGDYWHKNPNKYFSEKDQEIRNYDFRRISLLESLGYKVLIIWESEYRKDKDITINKCLQFINDNLK